MGGMARGVMMAIMAGLGATLVAAPVAAPAIISHAAPDSGPLDQRILAIHNRARASQGIPPLHWDPALAEGAAHWARELARSGAFEHADSGGAFGENLWAGTPGAFTPEHMVGRWVDEKSLFRPGPFPNNSATGNWVQVGHYTQLMWRATTAVGCALARGARSEVLVCRYAPAGNVYGEVPF
jgi:uncharacterized protein YkwD